MGGLGGVGWLGSVFLLAADVLGIYHQPTPRPPTQDTAGEPGPVGADPDGGAGRDDGVGGRGVISELPPQPQAPGEAPAVVRAHRRGGGPAAVGVGGDWGEGGQIVCIGNEATKENGAKPNQTAARTKVFAVRLLLRSFFLFYWEPCRGIWAWEVCCFLLYAARAAGRFRLGHSSFCPACPLALHSRMAAWLVG